MEILTAMNTLIFFVFSAGLLSSFISEVTCTAARFHREEVCFRQQKLSVVGYNLSTQHEIAIDVGECTTGDAMSSNQVIIRPKSDCVPYAIAKERILVHNAFILEMEKVLNCQKLPSTCQRLPRKVTYYPGTMYSRTIDVGVCGGLCRDKMGMMCMPTKNRTAVISTPNGHQIIEVIVDCSCVTPFCYRVSSFEAFSEQYTDVRGNKALGTKLIDMGKCVDPNGCPIAKKHFRSNTFSGGFHVHQEIKCSANKTSKQSYVAIGGRQVEVTTIDTCACN